MKESGAARVTRPGTRAVGAADAAHNRRRSATYPSLHTTAGRKATPRPRCGKQPYAVVPAAGGSGVSVNRNPVSPTCSSTM